MSYTLRVYKSKDVQFFEFADGTYGTLDTDDGFMRRSKRRYESMLKYESKLSYIKETYDRNWEALGAV